jgi:hypothetical protein
MMTGREDGRQMTCDKCGKTFSGGQRKDGIPDGITLLLKTGKNITVCADCLIKLGRASQEERDRFFEEMAGDNDETGG